MAQAPAEDVPAVGAVPVVAVVPRAVPVVAPVIPLRPLNPWARDPRIAPWRHWQAQQRALYRANFRHVWIGR
jgi:hypothetical protein